MASSQENRQRLDDQRQQIQDLIHQAGGVPGMINGLRGERDEALSQLQSAQEDAAGNQAVMDELFQLNDSLISALSAIVAASDQEGEETNNNPDSSQEESGDGGSET